MLTIVTRRVLTASVSSTRRCMSSSIPSTMKVRGNCCCYCCAADTILKYTCNISRSYLRPSTDRNTFELLFIVCRVFDGRFFLTFLLGMWIDDWEMYIINGGKNKLLLMNARLKPFGCVADLSVSLPFVWFFRSCDLRHNNGSCTILIYIYVIVLRVVILFWSDEL